MVRVTIETGRRGRRASRKAEVGCGSVGGHFETGQEGRDWSGRVTVDRFNLETGTTGLGEEGGARGHPGGGRGGGGRG